jgi:hypothetical protein
MNLLDKIVAWICRKEQPEKDNEAARIKAASRPAKPQEVPLYFPPRSVAQPPMRRYGVAQSRPPATTAEQPRQDNSVGDTLLQYMLLNQMMQPRPSEPEPEQEKSKHPPHDLRYIDTPVEPERPSRSWADTPVEPSHNHHSSPSHHDSAPSSYDSGGSSSSDSGSSSCDSGSSGGGCGCD